MVGLSFHIGGHFYLLMVLQSFSYTIFWLQDNHNFFLMSYCMFKQPKTKVETKLEGSIPFKTKNSTPLHTSMEFGINSSSQSLIIFVCFVVCHVEISQAKKTFFVLLVMLENTQ